MIDKYKFYYIIFDDGSDGTLIIPYPSKRTLYLRSLYFEIHDPIEFKLRKISDCGFQFISFSSKDLLAEPLFKVVPSAII